MNVIAINSVKHMTEPKGSMIYPGSWLYIPYKKIWNLVSIANIVVNTEEKNNITTASIKEYAKVKKRWEAYAHNFDKLK